MASAMLKRAGISQRPGTELFVRAPARTLRMVDSATSPADLSGTRARVYFRGVTVTSAPGPAGRPAPELPHRPYLRYLNRSTVSIVDSRYRPAMKTRFQAIWDLLSRCGESDSIVFLRR